MFALKAKEVEVINAAAHVIEKPVAMDVPSFVEAKRTVEGDLSEYAAVAAAIGIEPPQLIVEGFLAVLEKLQYPIYNRAEVVKYMDEKAAKDGKGFGWEWRPVRSKDHVLGANFGRPASFGRPGSRDDPFANAFANLSGQPMSTTPASDYYSCPMNSDSGLVRIGGGAPRTPGKYDKVIPLHALKRIAGIEREYTKPAHFLVSDYATEPHIKPDPFLMVVLPGVPSDMGRFVIDFWEEPGFGIEQMLK